MNPQIFQFPSNFELETSFEGPSVFESQAEGKAFLRFVQFVKNHRPAFRPEDSIKVRKNLKISVPAPGSIEDFRNLYEKCYLRKKFKFIDKNDLIDFRQRTGKSNYQKKNEKWKHEQTVLLVWVVSEYCHLQNLPIENLVKGICLNFGKFPFFENKSEDDWNNIGSLFPNTNGINCKYKWQIIQKSYSQKEEWTAQEDEILSQLVK